jgi:hypothetical protein
MRNFEFIQRPEKVSPISGFSSILLDNVTDEAKLQKQVINYGAYKRFLQSQKENIKT